jgi:AcrR family transcriptional regulator
MVSRSAGRIDGGVAHTAGSAPGVSPGAGRAGRVRAKPPRASAPGAKAIPVGAGSVDGLARGGVPEIQRARILAAVVEVARERGAGRVTVAHIVARSGVSRRTFYEMFEDRDACFVAAFEDAVRRAAARVVPAFRGGDGWRERVRAGLRVLLEFLDEEPGLGGLCIVDCLGAGPLALQRRAEVLGVLVDAVDEGRGEAKPGAGLSRMTAEGVVGGVLSVLYARLAQPAPAVGRAKPLVHLQSPLMAMIVLPYLGAGMAGRESARPAPRTRRRARQPRSNPLEGLAMRLTYRTVRVLGTIAAEPGACNREIGDAAGVSDQGQISKLLTRLEHLGLIENLNAGQLRGEPNAWRLTPRGSDVEETIRLQTTPTAASTCS